jgi:IPT/TIG domain
MKTQLFNIALAVCIILSCKKNSASSTTPPPVINQPPEISDFEPKIGAPGIPVQILGQNFDTSVNNLSVKFNGTPATIYSTSDQSM